MQISLNPKRIAILAVLGLLIWGFLSLGQFVRDSQKVVAKYHDTMAGGSR